MQPGYLVNVAERFGFYGQRASRPVIWIHAVSVGETRAAEPLVRQLTERHPDKQILVTNMTPTGRETSRDLFAGFPSLKDLALGVVKREGCRRAIKRHNFDTGLNGT